jgi:Protein of unknown function (DUF2793)
MAPRTLPGIGLKGFWLLGEDGWGVENDTNLLKASVLIQARVLSRVAALPLSPADGDVHLLTATANANRIAVRDNGAWVYFTPMSGWRVFALDEKIEYIFDGSSWAANPSAFWHFSSFLNSLVASAVSWAEVLSRKFDFPATGHYALCATAPSAATVFDIKKGVVSIGSITFALGSTTGAVTLSSTNLSPGDVISVIAPASLNGISGVSFSLKSITR